jgi:hypothetical protein
MTLNTRKPNQYIQKYSSFGMDPKKEVGAKCDIR